MGRADECETVGIQAALWPDRAVFGLFLPGKDLQRLCDFGQETKNDGFYDFHRRRNPGFLEKHWDAD